MDTVFGRKSSMKKSRKPSGICGIAVGLAIVAASAVPAWSSGPLVPAKADIRSVEIRRRPMQTVSYFGAGLRPPNRAGDDGAETEQFIVRWFAHSPGIPPGALVMLETLSDHDTMVRTRVQRQTAKSEGDMTSRFDIPAEDTRQTGPVGEWRVRIILRGRALATEMSPGWNAARKGAP